MEQPKMSKDETMGFHKGALATLSKEREELIKMLNMVEQIMKMHVEELKKHGIDLEAEAKKVQEAMKKAQEPKKTDEDIADRIG